MERQESHHRAETAAEAGVGRHHHPEVLPAMAGGAVAHSAGAQSSLRVPHLPGLAQEPSYHQGDKFLVTKTLPQVAGRNILQASAIASNFYTEVVSLVIPMIFLPFQCERFRTRFDQTARNRMREKVTASLIFKDRKSSYARR